MKRMMDFFAFLTFAALVVVSCSKNHDVAPSPDKKTTIPTGADRIDLVKMVPLNSTALSGQSMPFQEYYLLLDDGHFTKSRTQGNLTTSVSGTYTRTTLSDGDYFLFTYSSDTPLRENCGNEPKDYLWLHGSEIQGGAEACDAGPMLFFERKN